MIDLDKLETAARAANQPSISNAEILELTAEVRRLRKDTVRRLELTKTISEALHDNIVAMQSAIIEWQHGRGTEAGLQWIVNTLMGPGQLPDFDAPYGKNAQLWFNEHQAHPFPRCFCGNPSHIATDSRGYCSEEHARQDATRTTASQ
ncbi:hypothetical protein [Paraburkholderia bannensis]|uniref:hypothetical protein n=1 Tax=Paraburkholderia bannensis TaxID=765414 RepID=UPI002AB71AAB|nr:hypothetical protein [Paraburkholderia bannensis]